MYTLHSLPMLIDVVLVTVKGKQPRWMSCLDDVGFGLTSGREADMSASAWIPSTAALLQGGGRPRRFGFTLLVHIFR